MMRMKYLFYTTVFFEVNRTWVTLQRVFLSKMVLFKIDESKQEIHSLHFSRLPIRMMKEEQLLYTAVFFE